ncbi:uncharacterized protein [Leptinotarsa decemlineata]|uniref:uncharacterized protein n=1 Tax=Leptinotarsa decemlineata TaxID=7539 RepID=UPI003D3093F3
MKLFLTFICFIFGHQRTVITETCNNPEVTRNQVYIYRLAEEIKVKVFHCQFKYSKHSFLSYSDIGKNCRIASGFGVLKDKWGDNIEAGSKESKLIVEGYDTKADLISNEIRLRSGTLCRYDRGFCYDPKESVNYAVVWDITRKPVDKCPKKAAEKVFYGFTDIWDFPKKRLKYLFYYDDHQDEAFYLKLTKNIICNGKFIWYTEQNGFVVTMSVLDTSSKPSSKFYFPIKTKRIITSAIMRNCDLEEYMENLEKDKVLNSKTVDILMELYQKLKSETKTEIEQNFPENFQNATIDIRSN